jgi:hypothetical protein
MSESGKLETCFDDAMLDDAMPKVIVFAGLAAALLSVFLRPVSIAWRSARHFAPQVAQGNLKSRFVRRKCSGQNLTLLYLRR